MNITGKWSARAGSLLVMLGFFLPTLTVSCSVVPTAGQSFNLSQLASYANQPLLYLVPLGALGALVLLLLNPKDRSQASQFLMGQMVGLGVGVLSILIAVISLESQIQQLGGFDISPEFGAFVLVLGYGLSGAGILMQFGGERGSTGFGRQSNALAPSTVASHAPPAGQRGEPHLEVLEGKLAQRAIPIQSSDFSIGRSSTNDLQLPDRLASARHVRLRCAQGSWFIQDQGSSNGTFLNDRQVRAGRLQTGDRIRIGETIFVFRI